MTFAAMVSAMVVRRGLNNDWQDLPLPNTDEGGDEGDHEASEASA